RDIRARGLSETVFLPNYQWTSLFRFQGVASEQLATGTGRKSQFTLTEPVAACGRRSILVWETGPGATPGTECFAHREEIRHYELVIRGLKLTDFRLARYWN